MSEQKNINVASLNDVSADINNTTRGEFYDSPFGLCEVFGIGGEIIIIRILETGELRECLQTDLQCIPLSDDFLTHNEFVVIDTDSKYVKYERKDKWQTYSLIFDKHRKYYSYTKVGSCIPLRSVDQFQRLLKQVGFCENLLNSLKIEV